MMIFSSPMIRVVVVTLALSGGFGLSLHNAAAETTTAEAVRTSQEASAQAEAAKTVTANAEVAKAEAANAEAGKPASGTSRSVGRIRDPLKAAVNSSERSPAYVTRDKARHPYETLSFFGIRPDMTVVELTPGAGWYTEILAPYLREHGQYIGASYDPDSDNAEYRRYAAQFQKKLKSGPQLFDRVQTAIFEPPRRLDFAAPDSVDMVLTFRNLHNWVSTGPEGVQALLKAIYTSLKPGGIFGVVDHRLPEDKPVDQMATSGYLPEAYVIDIIEQAGFILDAKSEINANPKDTADHPHGVWALPPTYRNQDMGRERYEAIGESDRMTLRFIKPEVQ